MNWKKSICHFVALAVSAALCYMSAGLPALAASAASVQEYPIAVKSHEILSISGLTAREGEKLDYFYKHKSGGPYFLAPEYYQSSDGGKTWSKSDLSDYKSFLNQNYPQAEGTPSIYMAQNGDIYFTTILSHGQVRSSNGDGYGFRNFSVFKYSNGTVTEIAPLKMGHYGGVRMDVLHVSNEGDIVAWQQTYEKALKQAPADLQIPPSQLCYYNAKTNSVSKADLIVPREWNILTYANNSVFGFLCADDKVNLQAFDVKTGKNVLSIPIPGLAVKDSGSVAACIGPNNNLYVLCSSGIFVLKPGSKQLQKIVDVSSTRLAKNAVCFGPAAYAPDGSIYVPVAYGSSPSIVKTTITNWDRDGKILRFKLPAGV